MESAPAPPQETPEQLAARVSAENAAAANQTAASATAPAAAAAADAAQSARPELTDAEADKIGKATAKATIAELEARGVFETDAPNPTPAIPDGNFSPPDTATDGTGNDAAPAPGAPDESPKKRTLAARFMGIDS